MAVLPPPPSAGLGTRMCSNPAGEKYMHIFSIGTTGDWARWSKWKLGGDASKEVWQHESISVDDSAPLRLLPTVVLPTITNDAQKSIPVEQLGFCAIGAEDGEIYHIYKYVPRLPTFPVPVIAVIARLTDIPVEPMALNGNVNKLQLLEPLPTRKYVIISLAVLTQPPTPCLTPIAALAHRNSHCTGASTCGKIISTCCCYKAQSGRTTAGKRTLCWANASSSRPASKMASLTSRALVLFLLFSSTILCTSFSAERMD